MADAQAQETSFLTRQANFVQIGLDLVFYGKIASLVAMDSVYFFDVGIYTTLVGFLLYYVFSMYSFHFELRSLTSYNSSQQ
jgi:hypothetical protein